MKRKPFELLQKKEEVRTFLEYIFSAIVSPVSNIVGVDNDSTSATTAFRLDYFMCVLSTLGMPLSGPFLSPPFPSAIRFLK